MSNFTIDSSGNKRWFVEGEFHRLDGPAVEDVDGHKEWWVDGKPHRIDGPAVELADGSVEYWENGIQKFPRFRSIDSKFEVSCG